MLYPTPATVAMGGEPHVVPHSCYGSDGRGGHMLYPPPATVAMGGEATCCTPLLLR